MHPRLSLSRGRTRIAALVSGVILAALIVWVGPAHADTASDTSQPRGPRVFAGYKDDYHLLGQAVVGQLAVPAGNYIINAKLFVGPPNNGVTDHVVCVLSAGSDSDTSIASHSADLPHQTMALLLTHTFTSPGAVALTCHHGIPETGDADLLSVKLTAMQVDSLSTVALP